MKTDAQLLDEQYERIEALTEALDNLLGEVDDLAYSVRTMRKLIKDALKRPKQQS